jgi:hypothetical protein
MMDKTNAAQDCKRQGPWRFWRPSALVCLAGVAAVLALAGLVLGPRSRASRRLTTGSRPSSSVGLVRAREWMEWMANNGRVARVSGPTWGEAARKLEAGDVPSQAFLVTVHGFLEGPDAFGQPVRVM